MQEVLKWVGLIGAIWFAVSIPVALFLGRALKLADEPVQIDAGDLVAEVEEFLAEVAS